MSRSAKNQNCNINISVDSAGNVTVNPVKALPTGPDCTMTFNLTGNASWLGPDYITFADPQPPAGVFGTPTLGTNGKVTMTNTNADTGDYSYLIHYNLTQNGQVAPELPKILLTYDPDIQNSDLN